MKIVLRFDRVGALVKPLWRPIAEVGFAVFVGMLIGSFLMVAFGFNPLVAWHGLFAGAFGSVFGLQTTFATAMPIMLTALTFVVGMKSGIFNIGAEGQVYMGAVGAVVVGGMISLPTGLHMIAAAVVAMLFGALWAIPPAILKVKRGVDEIISTLMLNHVAMIFTLYLITNPLVNPLRGDITIVVQESARLPVLVREAALSVAIFIALLSCVVIYVLIWHTRVGYELRLIGDNPTAAHYAGLKYTRVALLSFIIGGLCAGLAGGMQILGSPPHWFLRTDMKNVLGLGWGGLTVALIGRNHPTGTIFAAIFMGGLINGSKYMQIAARVPMELVPAIQGIFIMALAIPGLLSMIRGRLK